MYYDERHQIYQLALGKWGTQHQTIVAMEELSELIKELSKVYRGISKAKNLVEEVADVKIMIEQIENMFALDTAVDNAMNEKLNRLKENL